MGNAVVMFLVNLAITAVSVYYQREQQKKMREAMKDRAATRNVRLSGSNEVIPLVYGYSVIVSPTDVYTNVASSFSTSSPYDSQSQTIEFGGLGSFSGNKNELLILQKVLCAGEVEDIIWVDVDEVDHNTSKYNGYTRIYADKKGGVYFNGGQTQRETTSTFDGICYSNEFFRMNRDDPQFNGKPQTLYYLKGRKVIIVQNDTTITQPKAFSNNTIDVLYDYLLDSEYGAGLSNSDLDLNSFYAARAIAARGITDSSRPVFGKIYSKDGITNREFQMHEFNGSIYPDKDHISNIGEILNSIPGAMLIRSANGKIKLSLPETQGNVADISLGTITDNLLVDDIKFAQPDSNAKLNQVRVSFPNSAKDFANDSYEYKNEEYFNLDNGILLSTEITANGISNVYHAEGFAKAMVNESRLSTFQFRTTHECLVYEPGDVIRLVSERNDLDRYVRITSVNMSSEFLIDFEAIEYDPSIYSYASVEIETEFQRGVFDFTVSAPSNVTVTSIKDASTLYDSSRVQWDSAYDSAVTEYVLQTTLPASETGGATVFVDLAVVPSSNADTYSFIHTPSIPGAYSYRVRAKTSLGRVSAWSNTATGVLNLNNLSFTVAPIVEPSVLVDKRLANGTIEQDTFVVNLSMIGTQGLLDYTTNSLLPPGEWTVRYAQGFSSYLKSSAADIETTHNSVIGSSILTINVDTSSSIDQAYIELEFFYNLGNDSIDVINDRNNIGLVKYTKKITLTILSEGIVGEDGIRGASWFSYSALGPTDFTAAQYTGPNLSQIVDAAFQSYIGILPVQYDKFLLQVWTDTNRNVETTVAFVYDGSIWEVQSEFITGNLLVDGTINANKLAVTQLDAISATIGTLRTATTGQRLEISDNVIKVFDSNNVIRVKIGNLS